MAIFKLSRLAITKYFGFCNKNLHMSNRSNIKILDDLHTGAYGINKDSCSTSFDYINRFFNRIHRPLHLLRLLCRIFFLFLSGTITLKTALKYFKLYLTKICKNLYSPFEKPNRLFKKYRIAPLTLMLNQWRIAHQNESLEQVLYAAMPRNPE